MTAERLSVLECWGSDLLKAASEGELDHRHESRVFGSLGPPDGQFLA